MHDLFQNLLPFKLLPIGSVEFVSLEFALFFLLFLPLYWTFGHAPKIQNRLLLFASLGWLFLLNPLFALVLTLYALLTAFTAFGIHATQEATPEDPEAGLGWLKAGLCFAVAHLLVYKYAGGCKSLLPLSLQSGISTMLIPLGLSYYTFQSITYLVAVYRRRIEPWPWYEVPMYLAFFPTVSAGPIWRADKTHSILGEHEGATAQLEADEERQPVRPALALSLALLGLIKIWWLAGTLNDGFVDPVFAEPDNHSSFSVLLAIYGYTVQLYLNFSGHADLAIGLAMLLGFRLPPNFAMPFGAHNLREFWNRWHISLSTWIRDYIYIPLGGNRCGFRRTQINVILAMTLSGLWHGSGWNFFVWGLLHGLALAALNTGDRLTGRRDTLAESRWGRALGLFCTFTFVAFAFVIFRSSTLAEAGAIFLGLFGHIAALPPLSALGTALLMVLTLLLWPLLNRAFDALVSLLERTPVYLWCLPLTLMLLFLLIAAPSGVPGFIYANF